MTDDDRITAINFGLKIIQNNPNDKQAILTVLSEVWDESKDAATKEAMRIVDEVSLNHTDTDLMMAEIMNRLRSEK